MRIFFLFASLLFSTLASANPVNYSLTFQVDAVSNMGSCPANPGPIGKFGCLAVGDTFIGTLSLDESVLQTEGVINDSGPSAFNLQFGALFYTNTHPSFVTGFMHVDSSTSMNPSVRVENGELVDLLGWIYGFNDTPYIEFFSRNAAFGEQGRFFANDGSTSANGSLVIARVPEPATLLLFIPALALLASTRRKQKPR